MNLAAEIAIQDPDDLTNGCFTFAESGAGTTDSLVVVDLHPARIGRYYDAFWDSYGLVGQMPIVAFAVTELIGRLLDTQGVRPIDLRLVHGDAYDAVNP